MFNKSLAIPNFLKSVLYMRAIAMVLSQILKFKMVIVSEAKTLFLGLRIQSLISKVRFRFQNI